MDKSGPSYPNRQAYFANRYCRLLTKSCAAQEIGHISFVLCATIAHLEDAKRYTGSVTFFNEQLMPLIAVTKWTSLARARKRAVQAGWLHYESGKRGQRMPGRYWVTIPDHLLVLDDSPCDETPQPLYPPKGERRGERGGERRGERRGEHSNLTLNLKKAPATAGDIPQELLQLVDGWNGLGDSIVHKGNGARRDPPAKAVLLGWKRASKDSEQREALEDIPALLTAIRKARYCHGKGWFDLPWLFGRNKNGAFNIVRLLAGAHDGDSGNGQPVKKPEPPLKYRA